MLEIVLNVLTNIIKFMYVYFILYLIQSEDIKLRKIFVWIIVYNMGYMFLKDNTYQIYIIRCLFYVGTFYAVGKYNKIDKSILLPMICGALLSYEIINVITNIVGVIIVLFVSTFSNMVQNTVIIVSVLLKGITIFYILKNIRRNNKKLIAYIKGRYLICCVYFLAICFKIPFLYTEIRDGYTLKLVLLSIACCTAIFFIISQIDKHNAAKEKAKVEESNKLLAAKLHKSQEILPAMVQVLSDVTEKNGAEMEERKAHELLEEVSHLYEQQLKENGKEDLQLKSFKSTGLTMLDKQLIVYQREAVDKEINLDIFVQAPINDVIWKSGIDQLRLQRAVGDLIRNSFQAVWKEQEKIKHVLLIVGCRQEDILEIAVMDNGVEIPLHVLETFGKRGVTTGGTGNGLADIWEFVQDAKASLRVDEFEGTADLFTKKISIIFDKKHICYLNSSRSKNVNGFFWNNKINE